MRVSSLVRYWLATFPFSHIPMFGHLASESFTLHQHEHEHEHQRLFVLVRFDGSLFGEDGARVRGSQPHTPRVLGNVAQGGLVLMLGVPSAWLAKLCLVSSVAVASTHPPPSCGCYQALVRAAPSAVAMFLIAWLVRVRSV